MNLAVHGLEGKIAEANTFYQDEHKLLKKADFVMANPPFNVDGVDSGKVKADPRLPFGLPGINKKKQVSNANYLWISYFYSYLNEKGRAGFVMSSQASSAGGGEKEVRRKLIETGSVDVMISIRSNFFYTLSVPCELWFLNNNKSNHLKEKVLMIDARHIYRMVTRRVYDFSPEQLKNITAIVWLYRGEIDKYLGLVESYFTEMLTYAESVDERIAGYISAIKGSDGVSTGTGQAELFKELIIESDKCKQLMSDFQKSHSVKTNKEQNTAFSDFESVMVELKTLKISLEHSFKAVLEGFNQSRNSKKQKVELEEVHEYALESIKKSLYFYKQIAWHMKHFPEAKLTDVPGLVKLVDRKELEKNDFSLTPGRYVGVAPEEEDEDFDFEQTMQEIHLELAQLNEEAANLAEIIQSNFEELGV